MGKNCEYTEKVDVYPYGIILWELLTCKTPFEEFSFTFSSQLEDAIVKEQLRPSISEVCSIVSRVSVVNESLIHNPQPNRTALSNTRR